MSLVMQFSKVKIKAYEVNEVIVGQDANIEMLKHNLQHKKLDKEYYSLNENELLMRKVVDGGH